MEWGNKKTRRRWFVSLCSSAPQARLELATLRLTAGCSTIELLRNYLFFEKNRYFLKNIHKYMKIRRESQSFPSLRNQVDLAILKP